MLAERVLATPSHSPPTLANPPPNALELLAAHDGPGPAREVEIEILSDPGSQPGNNGLASVEYQACDETVAQAMAYPLTDPDQPGQLNPAIADIFLLYEPYAPCKETFEYALKCGAPPECELSYGWETFSGQGFLDNDWCTSGLTAPVGCVDQCAIRIFVGSE